MIGTFSSPRAIFGWISVWTGNRLIAIEIDGNEPGGYARDIRRDRLLRRADVDVIHILNTEIDADGREGYFAVDAARNPVRLAKTSCSRIPFVWYPLLIPHSPDERAILSALIPVPA